MKYRTIVADPPWDRRVLYRGDFWARVRCLLGGHHWFGDDSGRHCTRCWRVEESA